jgi:uncharacterized coiled-coil protein SlyX
MDEAEANKAINALNKVVKEKKQKIKEIQEQIETLITKKANFTLQLEREQGRKQNGFWWILLCSLWILKITAATAATAATAETDTKTAFVPKMLLVVMCEYAFLALWRGFYVKQTKHAVPVGMVVVAFCLYFL